MSSKQNFRLLLAGFACMGALAACGSSSSSSASPSDDSATSVQASGGGDKTTFCADNAKLSAATAGVTDPSGLIPIFQSMQATLTEFQTSAPDAVKTEADLLVTTANASITSKDTSAFSSASVQTAGNNVDTFCGQNSDGTPSAG